MANLDRIPLQAADFRTSQATDWLDGLPLVGLASAGGVVPGARNVGNGGLVVTAIHPTTRLGAHLCAVTGQQAGQTFVTVTDPNGGVTDEGVVGAPFSAGGITFTMSAGATPFAVGDSFAIAVLPAPLDLTGLVFSLRAMLDARSPTIVLSAHSAPPDGSMPTILVGATGGVLALRVPQRAMARCAPGDYPYALIATDPASGLKVPAFAGTIRHRTSPILQD